ncbi:hypothetical protein EW145_g770 [Phellinidium pouzarii]|uniref:Glycosyltransferase family 8 protein n=1 Tax=Phellinidium pouzarii TaxID=167371 RepID=A0A4S4LHQ3_9AGAM|nr:hypothetical protein EW145_g770 [Phellinidium pouzarii]
MSRYVFEYAPLTNGNRQRRLFWFFTVLAVFIVIINVLAVNRLYVSPSPLDNFQKLNSLSSVYKSSYSVRSDSIPFDIPSKEERAVLTTIYSESYYAGVLTLGHSLQATNTSARRLLLYIPDRLSPQTLCRLEAGGWELHSIPRIPPPAGGKGVYPRFLDQYTKLQIWGLDKVGVKTVLYIDGDTLVRQNFDELWSLPFNFAAVPDVYTDRRGFTTSFNAGVMFLRMSSAVMEDMLSKIDTAKYKRLDAEQGFLNVYFAMQVIRLPFIYNANLALKRRSPGLWKALEPDMRIVHYTITKPFSETRTHRDLDAAQAMQMQNNMLREQGHADGGLWAEEMGWWDAVWRDTIKTLEYQC